MKKQKKGSVAATVLCALLLVIFIVGYFVANAFASVINLYMGTTTQKVVADKNAKDIYTSDYQSDDDLVKDAQALCEEVEGEGATLLLNQNQTLPLAEDTKFSCFSASSVNPVYIGTGSGSVNADDAVSLSSALRSVFGQDAVNTELWKFYLTSGYKRENASTSGGSQEDYRLNEVPWSAYSDSLKNTFAEYGDVALVTLSRSGGEGADLPNQNAALTAYLTEGDYLKLSQEEKDMFAHLKEYKDKGTFKKIVVLLNSANALQLDFLDDYGIDAVLWTGDMGMTGMNAVAKILAGQIVPSGRLVDTFLKDNHSSPAMVNYGATPYSNWQEYDLGEAQNNSDPGISKCNKNYVVYQEGIYVGYRYYETRYEDYVLGQGNAGDFVYDQVVAYPFGYGISYTQFDYSNMQVSEKNDIFTVRVDVTNTGSYDAKHTAQVYVQSPYTQYDKDNGIEKPAVTLVGFEKKNIKAGQKVTYQINVSKKDLVSYDSNQAKTYIMDAGDYYFTVGTDAHNAINNILLAKEKQGMPVDHNRMSGDGNADMVWCWENPTLDQTSYATSETTGYHITNQFEHADLNKYQGTADQTIIYLSRSDWMGTFPKQTVSLQVTEQMWKDGLSDQEEDRQKIVESMKQHYNQKDQTVPTMDQDGSMTLFDLQKVKAGDERWTKLIRQMSFSEMKDLICNGFHQTQAVESIAMPATLNENGPSGFTANLVGGASAMCYTAEDVMAATYNTVLLERVGAMMAEDFMHASAKDKEYAAMYGPGINIHRTPYSGRNCEYYSEDGWISGKMAAAEIRGIQSKGVAVFAKHFALNDQEEGRYGLSTWSNEQAIRELYLKGFEIAITEGKALGVMSSFNRLGVVWSGADYGLMTEVLRKEWDMPGAAVTDCSVTAPFMDYRMGILAGQNLWDGYSTGMDTLSGLQNDAVIVTAMQESAKRIAYTVSRTHTMNAGQVTIRKVTPWWKIVLLVCIVIFAILTLWNFGRLYKYRIRNRR